MQSRQSCSNIYYFVSQLSFCISNKPSIVGKYSSTNITTIPGKSFSLSVVGLNQLLKPIPSILQAEVTPVESNFTIRLGPFQRAQRINNSRANLKYRVFTRASIIDLTLYVEGPCNKLGTAARTVRIQLRPCPSGFDLAGDECICESDLLKYTAMCYVDDESIQNDGNF